MTTEHTIQRGIVSALRRQGLAFFAIPNGGARNVVTATRLKAEGVSAGVPDLFVPELRLFLETKTHIGRQSDAQAAWEIRLVLFGYRYSLVRTVEEAMQAVDDARAAMKRLKP